MLQTNFRECPECELRHNGVLRSSAKLVAPLRAGRSALVLRWLPYPVPSEVHAYSTPLTVSNPLCGIYGAYSG
jgi:hypothetical protein